MPKFLVQAKYTSEGVQGVLKSGGTARAEAVGKAVAGLGGSIHSFDYAFGDDDVVVLIEFPDNVAAAALAMAVGSTGAVSTHLTVLLSPEEIDRAAEMTVAYTPPGG